MSDHTDPAATSSPPDLPAGDDAGTPEGCERPWCGAGPLEANLQPRPTMPVQWLTAHPGNVRADLELSGEFVASITENGVLVPLRITIDGDGDAERYRVIDGHRRLAAAVQAGIAEVPYDMASGRNADEAGQYLDMYNAHHHRKGFTRLEEADALFAASAAGATKTRIRKSTGLKTGQVKTALAAATLTGDTRVSIADLSRERSDDLSLEDLAILAEFQDDPEALSQLMNLAAYHDSLEHQAERLRQQHADRARHEQLRAELHAGGLTVTDHLPPGALLLTFLTHEGEQLTPESHATCAGRGAYFRDWDLENPVHYCLDPGQYGHQRSQEITPGEGALAAPQMPAQVPSTPPAEDPAVTESRRRTTEGNRAWRAAAEVRHRWLAGQLLARRAAPREVDVFVAKQLLIMPEPLRRYLSSAHMSTVFTAITGKQAPQMIEACGTAPSRGLPLLMLAPIIAAYEHALTVVAGSQDTWQDTRFSPCPYADAGDYFTFLALVGYQLSDIEQSVADGASWTSDSPAADTVRAGLAEPDSESQDGADVPPDVPDDSPEGQDVLAGPEVDTSQAQAAA